MPPKQPTPHEFSKNLTYTHNVPAFLRAMKGMVPEEPTVDTKRGVPQRPEPGDGEEDPEDERPVVVQLNSKQLSAEEAERIRRQEEVCEGEGTRPKFRKPAGTPPDKKRKLRADLAGGGAAAVGGVAKKAKGKKKVPPLVQIGHLEQPEEDALNPEWFTGSAKGGASASGAATISGKAQKKRVGRLPQYDGAGDEDSADDAPTSKSSRGLTSLVRYYGDSDDEEGNGAVLPGLARYSDDAGSGGEENDKPAADVVLRVSSGPISKPTAAARHSPGNRKYWRSSPSRVSSTCPSSKTPSVTDAQLLRTAASPGKGTPTTATERILEAGSPQNVAFAAEGRFPAFAAAANLERERVDSFWEEMRSLLKPAPPDDQHPWALPPEPEGEPSADVQARIEKYHALRRQGLDYNENLLKNKKYRNPRIYSKLVEFVELDEIATNFPPDVYDPHGFDSNSYYDQLAVVQRKRAEELAASQAANRSSVAFTSSSKAAVVEPPRSIAASIAAAKAKAAEAAAAAIVAANRAKRSSKWDQPAPDRKRAR